MTQSARAECGNVLAELPPPGCVEVFNTLFANASGRVERIASFGHPSPPGFWYEQAEDEWAVRLTGTAELAFDDGRRLALLAGDWVSLPAHCRHRVESVSQDALWPAVHCRADRAITHASAPPGGGALYSVALT